MKLSKDTLQQLFIQLDCYTSSLTEQIAALKVATTNPLIKDNSLTMDNMKTLVKNLIEEPTIQDYIMLILSFLTQDKAQLPAIRQPDGQGKTILEQSYNNELFLSLNMQEVETIVEGLILLDKKLEQDEESSSFNRAYVLRKAIDNYNKSF